MFSAGETVVYGAQGICKIKGTTEMTSGRVKTNYYVLIPVFDENATIYVPTDNERLIANMRKVLSKNEIDRLIDDAALNKAEWIADDLKRKEYCSEIIKSGDRMELMRLIEMLYLRREDLKQTKKHFHIYDERYLREAERLLHDEFSYVLGIDQKQVPEYILNRIKK